MWRCEARVFRNTLRLLVIVFIVNTLPDRNVLFLRLSQYNKAFDCVRCILPICAVFSRVMLFVLFQIERLAQYERLAGGGCARRRAARLSDLERVQDLFPHDFLALHDADAPAALASHHAQVTLTN